MTVLVTGASGFLGRHVVQSLTTRGIHVRALVRRPNTLLFPDERVEVFEADLRRRTGLDEALDDVDTVVHLAAAVVGDDETRFKNTVNTTENLLDAMVNRRVSRIVHISSFSVYDWAERRRTLDEATGLEPDVYQRDSYAVAKLWQERIVRRAAEQHGWQATILRPGFLWGPHYTELGGVGQRLGPFHFVIAGLRILPLSFVANCADCVSHAVGKRLDGVNIFNVLDQETVSAWRYASIADQLRGRRSFRIYVPYWCGLVACKTARTVSNLCFGKQGKLPSILVTPRYRARFRPLKFSQTQLKEGLGWTAPYTFNQAVEQTRAILTERNANPPSIPSAGELTNA